MSLNISSHAASPSDDTRVFPKEPIDPSKNLSLFIKTVFKNSLESNMGQSEKELLLNNLRIIKSALEMTNTGIENTEEIIQQVKEIITCLESNKSYIKSLWKKKEVQLDQGRLVFSDSLKSILDDTSFEALMQSTPEEYLENITDCCFDGLSLESKSLETLLKYCPNITKEALEQITINWKEGSDIVALWPLFQQIPLQERPSIVTHSLKCLYNPQENTFINIDDEIKNTIIQNILAIPSEERENVIGLVVKCFHRDISGEEIAYLILNISQDSHEDQKRTVELASTCFHDGISEDEKSLILGAIARTHSQDRENIVTLSLKCFHESITGYDKAFIIETIAGMHYENENRENVVELSLKCFDDNTKGYEKATILQNIAQAPPEDRENIVELCLKCFLDGITGDEKINIIQNITKTPPEERENVIKLVLECLHRDITGEEIAHLIQNIAQDSHENRKRIVELASKCFHDDISEYEKSLILSAIAKTHPQSREHIVSLALKCFHDGIAGNNKAYIIETIGEIHYKDESSENIVALSLKCFDDSMTGREKEQIIQTVAQAQPEDRENIVELCLKCFNNAITGSEKVYMLTIVAGIPSQERDSVIALSQKCFDDNMTGYDRTRIIQNMAKIPYEDRENIVTLSLTCFHDGITADEKIDMIQNMAKISPQERDSIVALSQKCFDDRMTGHDKIRIIQDIAAVHDQDRANVIKYSIRCFSEKTFPSEKSSIIKSLSEIPSENRESIIEWSIKCFNGEISSYTIEFITKLENREDILELAHSCFYDGLPRHEKIGIIQAIVKIPPEERENVVALMVQYFKGSIIAPIIECVASISAQDRETIINLSSRCFRADTGIYEQAAILDIIAKIDPEERESFVQLISNYFPDDASSSIITSIAAINAQDRENVIKLAFKCFYPGIKSYEKSNIIKAIVKLSSEDRENIVTLALDSFPDAISGNIIEAIAAIDPQDRENTIKLASQCFYPGIGIYEKSGIMRVIAKIPSEDRESIVTLALECFPQRISSNIIQTIAAIDAQDRKDVLKLVFNYFQDNTGENEKLSIINAITKIHPEDRENVIKWTLKLRPDPAFLKIISIIPEKERSIIDEPFIQNFFKTNFMGSTDLLCIYLLPVTLRSKEVLSDLHSLSLNGKYDQELIASLEQKLSNETLPQATLIGLAQYAEDVYGRTLVEEHPLMQRVIELLAINNIEGIKNPFVLFRHLKELRNTSIDFKTPVGEAIPLRISMTRLQDMAKAATIKREDLPKKATKEAWELLKNDFKNKITTNSEKAEQALGQLATSWVQMNGPLFADPQNYLSGLFALTGPVSESEAKFKAIFNNILSKSTTLQNDQFFTEQEEVFIKTIMVIQHCKGGKQEGIAEAYKLLDTAYKYKLQLSPPMSVEERSNLERKEEATQFLRAFIQNHPITEEELIAHFKTDTLTNAGLFTALFGAGSSEKYLIEVEEDNDFVYHLNEAGAHEALSYIRDVEKKNLINYIAGIIRPVMERIISNDTFIEKLTEEKSYQGVHDSIYLKNTVGHLIGVTDELIFDRYIMNLSATLLEKSREDILKLLFTEVTPEVLISELVRVGLPTVYMKLFLTEEQVTEETAKKILELTGYLEP